MSETAVAVLPTDYSPAHWQAMKEMANEFYKSQALPAHLSNAARVVMVLQAGAEMGIPPVQAINTLYIVNGKVAMEGRAMLKQIMRGGVRVKWKDSTETKCTVVLSREGYEEHEETFTLDEAKAAGLLDKKGEVWKKYPKDMLRWRALSRGARFYCPDITEGIHLVEEIADIGKGARYNEQGVIEVESASPVADEIIEQIKNCPDRATYMKEILPKVSETKGLSYGERAAISKAAENRLKDFALAEAEAKAKKENKATEDALKESEGEPVQDPATPTAETPQDPDAAEITTEEMDGFIRKIRGITKQSKLITYVQDELNVLPFSKEQKQEIRRWVSNKIAQLNGKTPDENDLKAVFGY